MNNNTNYSTNNIDSDDMLYSSMPTRSILRVTIAASRAIYISSVRLESDPQVLPVSYPNSKRRAAKEWWTMISSAMPCW